MAEATDWKYKLYVIVSQEAVAASKGNRGKMISQGGHGFVGALEDARERFPASVEKYLDRSYNNGFVKITLIAPEKTLAELYVKYRPVCGVNLITDRAHTVFERPTITALGLGPIAIDDIGEDLSELKGHV